MPSVPDDPDFASSTIEELLGQIRAGLRRGGVDRSIRGALRPESLDAPPGPRRDPSQGRRGGRAGSREPGRHAARRAAARDRAESRRLRDAGDGSRRRSSGRVRREIWKASKRNRRGPVLGDPRIEQAEEKGYQPASNGEPRSTILFETWNDRLESAIRRVQGKNDDQRRLYEVLARLHVLKGWEYGKLARLVYGPGLEPDELGKAADRIRKWIREPVRHIRARRSGTRRSGRRNEATPRATGPTRGPANDDSTGDDRA